MCINPPTQWFMDLSNLIHIFSNERCIHEECILKEFIHWKLWLLVFYFVFCFYYSMFLNNIFYDVICLVNTNYVFILNNVHVKEPQFWSFLEGIVKETVNLLCHSFRTNCIHCCHEDVICFNIKEWFVILLDPW